MKTLLEIKNNYAQEQGYEDWAELIHSVINHENVKGIHSAMIAMEYHFNEICIRAQKASDNELIENHFKLFRRLNSLVNRHKLSGFDGILEKSREINRRYSNFPESEKLKPQISVFKREECIFQYCPNPEYCQENCKTPQSPTPKI